MIRSLLPRWLAWSCYVVALSTSLPAQDMLHTRDPAFHIPFNVDHGPQQGHEQGDQVRLFYSTDLGNTWQLYQQQRTDAGRFTFRTQTDGEYWFTVDLNGLETGWEKRPELRVVVDRQQPVVNLQLHRSESGRAVANWNAADAHLDTDSLQIEFLGAERQWQPVPIDPASRVAGETELKGTAEWWVAPHLGKLTVRLEVSDRAGNVALLERHSQQQGSAALGSGGSNAPATELLASTPASLPSDPTSPAPQNNGWTSVPEASLHSAGAAPATSSRPPTASSLAGSPTKMLRLSRTRRFKLEYEIDDANQGVHRIEVWYTRDRGRSWKHLGDDNDRQSPYLVELTEDGMFGFRLVVQATAGFFAQPPISGDPPDVWVHVDSLAPSVRMTEVQFDEGPESGKLRLVWQSSDENPVEQPVTLLFGESSEGPWRKMAEGQPSSGVYEWKPDQSMPAKFYVRVEARDRVGNVGGHTWNDVIASHHLQPQARIRGVRPAKKDSLFDAPQLR